MTTAAAGGPRTYQVRTYGCQMNVHDAEVRDYVGSIFTKLDVAGRPETIVSESRHVRMAAAHAICG